MGNRQSSTGSDDKDKKKPSLFQRMQDQKKSKPLSDEDILKYTGKTRDELKTWSESTPGVGRNQLSGRMAMGNTSGLGGMAAAEGYGGWGPNAEPNDGKRGMKFPPGREGDKKT
ncbi:hypothetical protein EDB81DRAFT_636458 [Dactylonectria macrodidyma]|uniref:Uncharacterized protein n=1 Tax=Dactylonectria macrodidyma TaxID=307937 RepID=A0A9P9FRK2_9HYPO|nr:hypothetical protein EDB81DRAFT_636458 [Dactylonectria macrodidyma]